MLASLRCGRTQNAVNQLFTAIFTDPKFEVAFDAVYYLYSYGVLDANPQKTNQEQFKLFLERVDPRLHALLGRRYAMDLAALERAVARCLALCEPFV